MLPSQPGPCRFGSDTNPHRRVLSSPSPHWRHNRSRFSLALPIVSVRRSLFARRWGWRPGLFDDAIALSQAIPAAPEASLACNARSGAGLPSGPRIRKAQESGRSENPDGVAFIQSMKTERRVMPAGPDIVHHRRAEAGRGGAFHAVLRLGLSLVRTIQARSGRASSAALTIADSKTGAPIRLPRLRPAGFPPEPNGRAGAARLQGSAGPGLRASRCRSDRGCARRTS